MAERPVCATCGNFDISAEVTSAYWNIATREFAVSDITDKGHWCDVCDEEIKLKWIETYTVEVTKAEFDTILAALRYWQRMDMPNPDIGSRLARDEFEIATANSQDPIDAQAIDAMIERINS
jgi:hypothetical protein